MCGCRLLRSFYIFLLYFFHTIVKRVGDVLLGGYDYFHFRGQNRVIAALNALGGDFEDAYIIFQFIFYSPNILPTNHLASVSSYQKYDCNLMQTSRHSIFRC